MSVYKVGGLSRSNEIRTYPIFEKTGNRPIARSLKLVDQEIFVVVSDNLTNTCFNIACGYYVSRFYTYSTHHDIEVNRLAVSIAGIIANSSEWGNLRPWTRMIDAFKKAGIRLKISEITQHDLLELVKKDGRYQEFMENWEDDHEFLLRKTHLPFIFACAIILSSTKNLNDNNFTQWFRRRILTFSGTTGDSWTPENTNIDQFPLLGQLQTLFIFNSANHIVRKTIYIEIVSIATSSSNFISSAFCEIHHLMRGLEMQHLILIDQYIFDEHPEFLNTILLRGLKNRFASAIKKLKSYPAQNRLYIKLLEDKDECALLNRKIFDEAATVATTIARIKNDTFDNYYINESKSHKRITEMVEEYFTLRYNIFSYGVGGKDKKNMSQEEYEKYLEGALKQLEKKYEIEAKEEVETEGIILPSDLLTEY